MNKSARAEPDDESNLCLPFPDLARLRIPDAINRGLYRRRAHMDDLTGLDALNGVHQSIK